MNSSPCVCVQCPNAGWSRPRVSENGLLHSKGLVEGTFLPAERKTRIEKRRTDVRISLSRAAASKKRKSCFVCSTQAGGVGRVTCKLICVRAPRTSSAGVVVQGVKSQFSAGGGLSGLTLCPLLPSFLLSLSAIQPEIRTRGGKGERRNAIEHGASKKTRERESEQ